MVDSNHLHRSRIVMPTVVEGSSRSGNGTLAVRLSMEGAEDGRRSPATLLIDTVELVDTKTKMPVPNHLLETKLYSKLGKNALVHVTPELINFDGFEVNQKHVKKLVILNASSDVLRMHLIPPQTKYFNIKYKKGERMVPGLTLECTIEFLPDEWRYYYDCIRINCPGDDNLVIPIHGYPVMSTKDFPDQFTFPITPVGHRVSHGFPLRCMAPVDFEFELIYIQPHPAFTIQPMAGIVPANSEVEVVVTFAPFEFQTAFMVVQLNISQYNARPIVCKFVGVSKPGLLREKTLSQSAKKTSEVLDPRCVSPLDRARHNRKVKPKAAPHPPKAIEYKGLQFPAKIETPSAVAQVLNQEPGKLKAKDLRETLLKNNNVESPSRQKKEARFEHAVRQSVYEERQNQLRWQVKVGDEQISNKQRNLILDARRQAHSSYRYKKLAEPIAEDEYGRQKTKTSFRRTVRDVLMSAEKDVTFDPYRNDTWATRHAALHRFIQAARQVILRNRAAYKLVSLRSVVQEWSRQKTVPQGDTEEENADPHIAPRQAEGDEDKEKHLCQKLTAQSIQRMRFPTYIPPDVKDDMAADALGPVPQQGTHVQVKEKVPYCNLKVPQIYQLQGYHHHGVHDASSGFVPPCLTRPLRVGAQDEVISLPQTHVEARVNVDGGVCEDDGNEDEEGKESVEEDILPAARASLLPPDALFQPIEYPPLHIMNPAPGLQIFQAPMPFAEVDSEFHLCPLPRYFRRDYASCPHAATQRKYLDREDTIRGLMSWKKFPSQGLTSLSNTPTLTNVWVPRWDDTFSKDLLPLSAPPLFDGLPADETGVLLEGSEWDEHVPAQLTPEMVNAQYAMVDVTTQPEEVKPGGDVFPLGNRMPPTNIPVGTFGPVPREKREEELEYFMTKKYNRLGSKMANRVCAHNVMLTQPNLRLQ